MTTNANLPAMKKMSEVFELPVDGHELPDFIMYTTTGVDDDAIAHATNHADALADALELSLNDRGMIHIGNDKHLQAKAALAAYRGEA